MTEKISLQLAIVLPGVPDERDACIQRLIDLAPAPALFIDTNRALARAAVEYWQQARPPLVDSAGSQIRSASVVKSLARR